MFKKKKGWDNELSIMSLENKLDILIKKSEEKDQCGCCGGADLQRYNELKVYIQDKFTELEKDICDRNVQLDKNLNNIQEILSTYKTDVLTNIEFVIDHIYRETQSYKNNIIFNKISDVVNQKGAERSAEIKALTTKLEELKDVINNVVTISSVQQHQTDVSNKLSRCKMELEDLRKELMNLKS
jgi:hypothetical protein